MEKELLRLAMEKEEQNQKIINNLNRDNKENKEIIINNENKDNKDDIWNKDNKDNIINKKINENKENKEIIENYENNKCKKNKNNINNKENKCYMENKENKENKEFHNKRKFMIEDKYIDKKPNPIFNLITTNNNQYLDKKDNDFNPPKKGKRNSRMIVINNYHLNMFDNRTEIMNRNKNNEISQKELIIQKTREIMAYNDEELNLLSYNIALKYDKRTYCEYYISLIKTKHILIFSLFYSNDYNSKIIKIDLFFINFVMYFTVNAFFFDDNTMHKIYEDKGKYHFIYQLPQIIYSTIIFFGFKYNFKIISFIRRLYTKF